MTIIDYMLPYGEYYADIRKKDTIYIHHTAGGHRPDWAVDGWKFDRTKTNDKLAVATSYIIGGLSTSSAESAYDGVVYRTFDEKYWAHHLGIKQQNNRLLNQRSIAIELCNYGPLVKTKSGEFINYVNKAIPLCMVGTLDQPWRGFRYFHKYTPKQLESLGKLLREIANRNNIDLKKGIKELLMVPSMAPAAFELSDSALKGLPGLWTHANVRRDKTDCWPQPELIGLIQSL